MATLPTNFSLPAGYDLAPHDEPAWELALLYPRQGDWSSEDYLHVAESTNRLVELNEGRLVVLPMPTIEHQLIVRFLLDALRAFVETKKLGQVLFSPLPVWTHAKTYREPDVIFQSTERHAKSNRRYYEGADLVMEVVSADAASHQRDYEDKVRDYLQAGVAEYWIVDPFQRRITVLVLEGDQYTELGVFGVGDQATSQLLQGFDVSVADVLAAGKE